VSSDGINRIMTSAISYPQSASSSRVDVEVEMIERVDIVYITGREGFQFAAVLRARLDVCECRICQAPLAPLSSR
jgi:hypothetical protein